MAASRTARFSTSRDARGHADADARPERAGSGTCTRAMKCCSIVCATSKSAMTPSLSGRTTSMLAGVRPSMALAAWPTASTVGGRGRTATMDGSVEDDALAPHVEQGVRGAQVDADVVGEPSRRQTKLHQHSSRPMGPVHVQNRRTVSSPPGKQSTSRVGAPRKRRSFCAQPPARPSSIRQVGRTVSGGWRYPPALVDVATALDRRDLQRGAVRAGRHRVHVRLDGQRAPGRGRPRSASASTRPSMPVARRRCRAAPGPSAPRPRCPPGRDRHARA